MVAPKLEQPTDGSSGVARELLEQLKLASLEPAASAAVCSSAALSAQAGLLAELAVASGEARQAALLLQQLPGQLLLSEVVQGMAGRPERMFSAWQHEEVQGADPAAAVATATAGVASLQPLRCLLGSRGLSDGQRSALLLAAARAATAGGNAACARRLHGEAGAATSAASVGQEDSLAACARKLLLVQELQAGPQGKARSMEAWQLLEAALATEVAASVVPAAARLLTADPQPYAGILPAEARKLAVAADVILSNSAAHMRPFEQLLVQPAAEQSGNEAAQAAALHYAALKAAVASAPRSASQWCQWAAWLHRFALQQQEQQSAAGLAVTQAAWAASFAASCQALVHGAASGVGESTSGFGALPVLLQVLQMLGQQGSAVYMPSDAAAQLAGVPAAAWLPVVPQLISTLAAAGSSSSGNSNLELALSLLHHIGSAAPCQVLLPALVATAQATAADAASAAPAGRPLGLLVQRLQGEHPALARQLRVLVTEAARLAVLPEEHWQAVLQEAAATAAKRLQAQQRAARRMAAGVATGLDSNAGDAGSASDGPAEGCSEDGCSYLAALGPVLLPLQQQLQVAEAAQPQTPHERRFQLQWLTRLQRLLQQLVEPLSSPCGAAPAGAGTAAPTPEQQQRLHQRPVALLRAAASELAVALRAKQLALADVAPALAELADTGIPIPGSVPAACAVAADAAGGSAPTLARVAGEVAVLSTKTRPKRLTLIASDGSQHSFLLKARPPVLPRIGHVVG